MKTTSDKVQDIFDNLRLEIEETLFYYMKDEDKIYFTNPVILDNIVDPDDITKNLQWLAIGLYEDGAGLSVIFKNECDDKPSVNINSLNILDLNAILLRTELYFKNKGL